MKRRRRRRCQACGVLGEHDCSQRLVVSKRWRQARLQKKVDRLCAQLDKWQQREAA